MINRILLIYREIVERPAIVRLIKALYSSEPSALIKFWTDPLWKRIAAVLCWSDSDRDGFRVPMTKLTGKKASNRCQLLETGCWLLIRKASKLAMAPSVELQHA